MMRVKLTYEQGNEIREAQYINVKAVQTLVSGNTSILSILQEGKINNCFPFERIIKYQIKEIAENES